MSEDAHEVTVADEIDSLVRRAVKDASKRTEELALSNDYGEPGPYVRLLGVLDVASEIIERHKERLRFLQQHFCQYDERDYCVHCGRDGRA